MEVKTDYYHLSYDSTKNRIYLILIGFWASTSIVPDFYTQWERLTDQARPDFTVYVDARKLTTPPESVTALHKKAQECVLNKGMSRRAEIVSESVMAKISIRNLSQSSGIESFSRRFSDPDEAELWLDSPQPVKKG